MPTYDYQCLKCDARFQARHSMSAPKPLCPECEGDTRRLILSAPVVHGAMAAGRELAMDATPQCGKGCRCCP